jgi:ribosomal protein S18
MYSNDIDFLSNDTQKIFLIFLNPLLVFNQFISEQGKILTTRINRLTFKQQRFIRKERKIKKKASNFLFV